MGKQELIAKSVFGEHAVVYHAKIIIGKTEPREALKEVPKGETHTSNHVLAQGHAPTPS